MKSLIPWRRRIGGVFEPFRQELDELSALVKRAGPVCLLCYERDHRHCHRRMIAEIIEEHDGVKVENLAARQV